MTRRVLHGRLHGAAPLLLCLMAGVTACLGVLAMLLLEPSPGSTPVQPMGQQPRSLRELTALPYITHTPASTGPAPSTDEGGTGVAWYRKKRVQQGLNFVVAMKYPVVWLMDLEGTVLHRWTLRGVLLDHAALLPDGHILAIDETTGRLLRVDANSTVVWERPIGAFHSLDFTDDGQIVTLIREVRFVEQVSRTRAVLDMDLALLSPAGKVMRRVPLSRLLAPLDIDWENLRHQVENLKDYDGPELDLLHANTASVIRHDVFDGKRRLFGKGDFLICIRNLDLLVVVNLREERIVWHWGRDVLDLPHHPSVLENGHILVFDNGLHRRFSRLLEVEPATGKVLWQYVGRPPETFFSTTAGSVQRLPNGNTLLTSSNQAYALELTPRKQPVWEYVSTIVENGFGRRGLWRVTRIPEGKLSPWMRSLRPAPAK